MRLFSIALCAGIMAFSTVVASAASAEVFVVASSVPADVPAGYEQWPHRWSGECFVNELPFTMSTFARIYQDQKEVEVVVVFKGRGDSVRMYNGRGTREADRFRFVYVLDEGGTWMVFNLFDEFERVKSEAAFVRILDTKFGIGSLKDMTPCLSIRSGAVQFIQDLFETMK